MLGSDNFVGGWFVMNIHSALTAPSSISPASGLRFGGGSETRSKERFPWWVACHYHYHLASGDWRAKTLTVAKVIHHGER